MRESKLQRACLDWARGQDGVLTVNIHGGGYSNKGFPDILVFARGRAAAVELKADSGYALQPDQMVWRKRFNRCGVPYVVLRSLEEFKDLVKGMTC